MITVRRVPLRTALCNYTSSRIALNNPPVGSLMPLIDGETCFAGVSIVAIDTDLIRVKWIVPERPFTAARVSIGVLARIRAFKSRSCCTQRDDRPCSFRGVQ